MVPELPSNGVLLWSKSVAQSGTGGPCGLPDQRSISVDIGTTQKDLPVHDHPGVGIQRFVRVFRDTDFE